MEIYPRTKIIKSDATGNLVVGLLIFAPAIYFGNEIFTREAFIDDPVAYIIVSLFIPWFFIYMIAYTARLFRLGRLQGPLISIFDDGIIDHFESPQKLTWKQIKFIGCKETIGRETYKYFVIRPKKTNWVYWVKRLYSHPMKYKLDRLLIHTSDAKETNEFESELSFEYAYESDIQRHLKKVAPKSIL